MSDFIDNFSAQSEIYAKYRPHYPKFLFEYLSALSPGTDLAVDCGTGNGQAAVSLTSYFKKVIATDGSEEQLKNAVIHPHVVYENSLAEKIPAASNSVDLVTIANAMHWFELDLFFTEVKRVLKKDGIIAAWGYIVPEISPEIDPFITDFHNHVVGEFWVKQNKILELEYKTINFPFSEIEPPEIFTEKLFDLNDLIGYLTTWSATQKYIKKYASNPTVELRSRLLQHWGDPNLQRVARWRLIFKIGRK